ncbi:cation:proton antiporter [Methylocystis sp. MJC1]|uniref:cation:proton antiporter domain-containing protein n=1 Tax=Methylocystis sp. MJC1 TaxID=2654282 RepID=UPI0013EDA887|nr:cation:proton antiporter [Methylocystis sp. MJC1]KAF2989686.1 Glutathione-regulated potassium-efflux system protein KefC [Methylocystis sp. MJC1]MBU6525606.1 cation:proton antiporter [Methylocystis sp. MJC1]UZX12082.1 cation:proton antiporter [Methylocystis sp. MJC1]
MGENPLHLESYREALVFLATAGVVVPLFHRLRVSPVLGFLLAGAALGPHGLGSLAERYAWLTYFTIADVEGVGRLAEFGLVFLLFMIGLELSWERLARMRRLVFGLGLAQVAVCATVLALVGRYWFGVDAAPSILMGVALAMSSTAVVMPVLSEGRRVNKSPGRVAFSVLLLQDLMVAPALFFVTVLAEAKNGFNALQAVYTLLPAFVALAGLIVFGRLLLRPLFRLVAAAQLAELFVAACLLVIVGEALVTAAAGLSMGLGAFIAGLLLAETEFRREIEVTIEPFKGLLLGLFFVSVGAELDIGAVVADPAPTIIHTLGLIAVKAAIIFSLALLFRIDWRTSTEAALLLAPGGEFAFALLTAAMLAGVLPGHNGAETMVVVTLSIFFIPFLGRLGARLSQSAERASNKTKFAHLEPENPVAEGRVLIVGYGRVGSLVGDMLSRHDVPFVAVENLVSIVTEARQKGVEIYWGNAARKDFLIRCGLEQARALVVTIENPTAVEEIVRIAGEIRTDLIIVARARDARHATTLYALGASDAIPETIEASLQLAETVLVDVGVPMGYVIASIHEKRDDYRKILQPTGEEARARQTERRNKIKREQARRRIAGRPVKEAGEDA